MWLEIAVVWFLYFITTNNVNVAPTKRSNVLPWLRNYSNVNCTFLRRTMRTRSWKARAALKKRKALTMIRAGWTRWGSSGVSCGPRRNSAGLKKGSSRIVTPVCRVQIQSGTPSRRRLQARASHASTRSSLERSSAALGMWHANRRCRSKCNCCKDYHRLTKTTIKRMSFFSDGTSLISLTKIVFSGSATRLVL